MAQHQSNPSPSHLESAHYVVHYLANTKKLGIYFTSTEQSTMESFLHFPLPHQIMSMADTNWGPHDASQFKTLLELSLFVSCSISAI